MLSDTAIPVIMMTPISDMTLRVVPVTSRKSITPESPGGTASRMMNGSENEANCAIRIEVDQNDGENETDTEALKRVIHVANCATAHRRVMICRDAAVWLTTDSTSLLTALKVLLLRHDVDVEYAAQLIVVDFGWSVDLLDGGDRFEWRRVSASGARSGICLKSVSVLIWLSGY